MNNVQLSGYIVREPEVRYTKENKMVINFTIACRTGEVPDYINCVGWEKTAEFINKYFHQGNFIVVPRGKMKTRSYEDKDGKKVHVTEVYVDEVEFGGKKENEEELPF